MKKLFLVLTLLSTASIFSMETTTIERALRLQLLPTTKEISPEADTLTDAAFEKVKQGNYGESLSIIVTALEKFPKDFTLQTSLATVLGDYSGHCTNLLQAIMVQRSKEIFEKLVSESEDQPKRELFYFKNEYFYRFARYKEQYELGLEKIAYYEKTDNWNSLGNSFYTQGVGAANYARELLKQDNKALAFDYAQKAVVAWAQHFTYNNGYYNSYVHYALALGILGYKQDMMRALKRAADLINHDLNFHKFKEVIDFVDEVENGAYTRSNQAQ